MMHYYCHVLLLIVFFGYSREVCGRHSSLLINVSLPHLALNSLPFAARVSLPPYDEGHRVWPSRIYYEISTRESDQHSATVNTRGFFNTFDNQTQQAVLQHDLPNITVEHSGVVKVYLSLFTTTLRTTLKEPTRKYILEGKKTQIRSVPGWVSLTPPCMTVFIAIVLQQVFLALILGIWLGCFFMFDFNPLIALLRTFDVYFTRVINYQSGHAQVVVFCFLLGGLIGMVQKGGGAQGLGKFVTSFTTTRSRAFLALISLNFLIFFDDYSAILIVGTTFLRIVDDLFISRAKFAFIIHGISACFVSIVPISSWVGVQIGYIQGEKYLKQSKDPFIWFLSSIPYRFFPLFWIIWIFLIVMTKRDFGPMLTAEKAAFHKGKVQRSKRLEQGIQFSPMLKLGFSGDVNDKVRHHIKQRRKSATEEKESPLHQNSLLDDSDESTANQSTSKLDPKPGTPLDRWYNAALPFSVVALCTFFGMYYDGSKHITQLNALKVASHATSNLIPSDMLNIFTYANSFNALMWGSMFGCCCALILYVYQRILTLNECMEAWVDGIAENILSPIIILLLAWALGQVIQDMNASVFLAQSIGESLNPGILPLVVTVICFGMSLATGTAFGSMGIMFPLIIPLAYHLQKGSTGYSHPDLLEHCVGSILGGSLFGNVISPIADDTILASMAGSLEVTKHIRTMFPYVILVGVVSLCFGSFPVGMGYYGPGFGLLFGSIFLLGVLVIFGNKNDIDDHDCSNDTWETNGIKWHRICCWWKKGLPQQSRSYSREGQPLLS